MAPLLETDAYDFGIIKSYTLACDYKSMSDWLGHKISKYEKEFLFDKLQISPSLTHGICHSLSCHYFAFITDNLRASYQPPINKIDGKTIHCDFL